MFRGKKGALAAEPNATLDDSITDISEDIDEAMAGSEQEAQEVQQAEVQSDSLVSPIPICLNEEIKVKEDTSGVFNIQTPSSDNFSVQWISKPAYGTIADNGDGTYTYMPNGNYHGSDVLSYVFINENGAEVETTVYITVTSVNDAPIDTDDAVETDEDTPLVICEQSLLANDKDIDNSLHITEATDPERGVLADNGDGIYTYTPNTNYNGSDSFIYTVSDGVATDTATVTVIVNAVGDAPTAVNDEVSTDEDTAVVISALIGNDGDADGDTLCIISMTNVAHGTLANNGDDTYTYTPDVNYNGADSFTYTITDGEDTATATVSITVNTVNQAPIVNNESTTVDFFSYSYQSIYVLSNDSDPDGDTLTITRIWGYSMGSVINDGYRIRYESDHYFMGTDTVYYEVSDGHGGTATGNLTVYIDY